MDLKCTGRARSRGGALAPLEAPQGPHAARREALERRGGMGFPPWGFLDWGAPRKGGFQGGKPRRGARGAPCAHCLAGRPASLAGRAGAERRSSRGRHHQRRGRRRRVDGRDARGEARSEEARSSAGSSGCSQRSGRHSGARADGLPPARLASPGASRRLVRSGCIDLHHPSSSTSFSSASSSSSALGFAAPAPLRSSRDAG